MAERPESIAESAEPAEASRHARGGPRVVVVRSAAARSAGGTAGGKTAGKTSGSSGKAGSKSSSRKRSKGASVRSASAPLASKAGKGTTKKAGKKAAKATRKGPTKKAGSRPAGKKGAPKKAARKAAVKARKAPARKPAKRAGTHKAVKGSRKPTGVAKKTPARAPAKAGRQPAAKKPAKRPPAKKAVKPARKAAKETPLRPAATPAGKIAPPKPAPVGPGEAVPEAPRRVLMDPASPAAAGAGALAAPRRPAEPARRRKAEPARPGEEELGELIPPIDVQDPAVAGVPVLPGVPRARGDAAPRKRRKVARFDNEQPEVRRKKRARLEKMRRAGIFGVPGARPRRLRKRKVRDEVVRPSPPLEKTDPLKHYFAGEMVPCPVGCGGFSEVVRVSTMESGAGEIWFECLSCAQRKMFEIPPATMEEQKAIFAELEAGHEPLCPRHTKTVSLRRRGFDFVCPECGVRFAEP